MSGDSELKMVAGGRPAGTVAITLPSGVEVEYSPHTSAPGVLKLESDEIYRAQDEDPPHVLFLGVEDVSVLSSFMEWMKDPRWVEHQENWDALFGGEPE